MIRLGFITSFDKSIPGPSPLALSSFPTSRSPRLYTSTASPVPSLRSTAQATVPHSAAPSIGRSSRICRPSAIPLAFQVRSVTYDVKVWEPAVLDLFQALGNSYCNSVLEELLPQHRDFPQVKVES
ncbi:hypothetical protein ACS0TY_021595 [Phlomoides rotata]